MFFGGAVMFNSIIAFKDSILEKFGPILGWAILGFGGIIALSLVIFLIKTVFSLFIWLVIVGVIGFGGYKLYEMFIAKK